MFLLFVSIDYDFLDTFQFCQRFCVSTEAVAFLYVMQADLSKPETIPATLVGIHTIIDCATGRPEEPIKTVIFVLSFYIFFYNY